MSRSALKAVHLAIGNLEKKWIKVMKDWEIIDEWIIQYEDQCTLPVKTVHFQFTQKDTGSKNKEPKDKGTGKGKD